MKKAANADIRNLFRKFGGDSGSYQEIQQDYVIDKAEKSWPIVTAIEKERASAPVLRASVEKPAARAPGEAVARHAELPARRNYQAEGTAFVARQAAEPAAPLARPLFGALSGAAKPVAPPENSLFAALKTPAKSAALFSAQASENDPLSLVFSRLLNPQNEVASPDKSLRSLFGFLKK